MTIPENTVIPEDLKSLRFHWGEAYQVDFWPGAAEGRWQAHRRDDHQTLTGDSAAALRDVIIIDYIRRPVSRTGPLSRDDLAGPMS